MLYCAMAESCSSVSGGREAAQSSKLDDAESVDGEGDADSDDDDEGDSQEMCAVTVDVVEVTDSVAAVVFTEEQGGWVARVLRKVSSTAFTVGDEGRLEEEEEDADADAAVVDVVWWLFCSCADAC